MSFVDKWRQRRFAKRFKRVGRDCRFNAEYLEIKGHVELGDRCTLENNVLLRTHEGGKILIGNDVLLGVHVMIASNDRVEVGANSTIDPYTVLRDMNHSFHGTDVHWRLTPHQTAPIIIGEGCHIGPHCYILPGVTMGDGAVILPRSMVKKDVGANEIWAGAPVAQRIGHRGEGGLKGALKRHGELLGLYGFSLDSDDASGDDAGKAALVK